MFAVNGLEALVTTMWLVGVFCAVANFTRGYRGVAGVALIAVSAIIPVLGSIAAIAIFVMHLRIMPSARRLNNHGE